MFAVLHPQLNIFLSCCVLVLEDILVCLLQVLEVVELLSLGTAQEAPGDVVLTAVDNGLSITMAAAQGLGEKWGAGASGRRVDGLRNGAPSSDTAEVKVMSRDVLEALAHTELGSLAASGAVVVASVLDVGELPSHVTLVPKVASVGVP